MRALVVEDEREVADDLTRALQAAGFVVDGPTGIATADSLAHGYRIALLTLAMLALGAAVLSSTLLAPPRPAEAADEPFDEPVREAA